MANKLDYAKIARALTDRAQMFKGAVAKVGIPAGKTYPDGTSIAYVGVIHEFGAPEVGIPQRSWLRSTRNQKRQEWAKNLAEGAQAVVQRRISLTDMLDAVGSVAAADVVQTIANRIPPPLKPATVAARISRARKANPTFGKKQLPVTISTPLDDTGALVAHISYGTGEAGETFESGTPAKG
jgi:hypothetical protein